VDHPLDRPLDPTDALVRPWRTAAYLAGAVAAVELVVLIMIGGGALLHSLSDRLQLEARKTLAAPSATAPTGSKGNAAARELASIPAAKRPRSRTTVLVLNGNGRTGAAAEAASRVSNRGYRIGRVGNAPRSDFARSLVMYRPGFAGEGRRLAKDLGVKLVGPLDGMRLRDLGRAHVVYILGG
jgi:LytR cell envelope-related transcriptional attenuator